MASERGNCRLPLSPQEVLGTRTCTTLGPRVRVNASKVSKSRSCVNTTNPALRSASTPHRPHAGRRPKSSARPRCAGWRGRRSTRATGSRRREPSLREGDFDFLGAPRGVRQSSADVVGPAVRVCGQDVRGRLPCREQADDGTRRHSQPTDARTAAHHLGVMRDSREGVHPGKGYHETPRLAGTASHVSPISGVQSLWTGDGVSGPTRRGRSCRAR
jgi:hypothetical protein